MSEVSKHEGFIPPSDDKLRTFLLGIVDMCDFIIYEVDHKYGISHVDAASLKDISNALITSIKNVEDHENALTEARTSFEDLKEEDFPQMSDFFNRIKASPNTSDAMVEKYKIKGKTISIDVNDLEANLKLIKVPNGYEIRFSRHGYRKLNMNVYVKKPDDTKYNLLASISKSPYKYAGTFPAGTLIYGVFTHQDIEVGHESDIIEIKL